jgi:hypothetical protein
LSAKRGRRLLAGLGRSPLLSSLNYGQGQVRYRLGLADHRSGAINARYTLEQSVEYVLRCVGDYLRYAGVDDSYLEGKRILELGPGDNLGVALVLLAKGAGRVVCVDAFDPPLDARRAADLYRALHGTFSTEERARAERSLRVLDDGAIAVAPERLSVLRGTRIEDLGLAPERFDVVLSRAVLEHAADVERTWAAAVALLDSPGAMWHKIDFRHHGYFGHLHPLYFLTRGERSWRWVSSPDPTLNRRRIDTYRRLAAATFRETKIFVTHVLENPEIVPHVEGLVRGIHYGEVELDLVRQIRPLLRPGFRQMTDEELLIAGVFLVCRDLRGLPEPAQSRTIGIDTGDDEPA